MARNDRDHGGGLDSAIAQYGGDRAHWLDLSTGINPAPYPVGDIPTSAWTALPDDGASDALIDAVRVFWDVPSGAAILAVPGCSAAIAQIPGLLAPGTVQIEKPTYNEHAAGFAHWGWTETKKAADAAVIVHPNNPTGHFHTTAPNARLTIIDESFCDIAPAKSLIRAAAKPGVLVLKSFGKFWGLAGLRLGFVIGDPNLIALLKDRLGPWPVSGPALSIGAAALCDNAWAEQTRLGLAHAADRLDRLIGQDGGETSLFRTYRRDDAQDLHKRLAQAHIWTRVFPYDPNLIRFGLPPKDRWPQLENAI